MYIELLNKLATLPKNELLDLLRHIRIGNDIGRSLIRAPYLYTNHNTLSKADI